MLLFGRDRVSRRFYYVSTWLVVLGAHLSAFWIIIANSWQQTPAGYKVEGGKAVLTDFFAAAFNPSTLPRYVHTVVSTWVAGAFIAAGIAAYYLRRGTHTEFAKRTLGVAVIFGLVMSAAMPLIGDWQARVVAETNRSRWRPSRASSPPPRTPPSDRLRLHRRGRRQRAADTWPCPSLLSFLLTGSTGGVGPRSRHRAQGRVAAPAGRPSRPTT